MGKPNNFPSILGGLSGDLEIYTQEGDNPRKFTVDQVKDYVENNISISGGTAVELYDENPINPDPLTSNPRIGNTVTGTNATSIGDANTSSGAYSFALGYNNSSTGALTFAIGINSEANGLASVAIGAEAIATEANSVAIGRKVSTFGEDCVGIGNNMSISGNTSFGLGKNLSTVNDGSMLFGDRDGSMLTSSAANRMEARFENGYQLFTNAAATVGVQAFAGATSWSSISDKRAKENIKKMPYGLNSVMQLNTKTFNYKGQPSKKLGLIAQEVKDIVPEVVNVPSNKDEMMSIAYTELIPVLIKSIQDLKGENDKLRNEINALKEAINS